MRPRLAAAQRIARELAAGALSAAHITDPARTARDKLTIVAFHRVLPEALRRAYPYPVRSITPEHLDLLLGHCAGRFSCGPLSDLYRRFVDGSTHDKPLLAIVFDDCAGDAPKHAAPVLAARNLAATFYLAAGAIEESHALWHDVLGFAVVRGFESEARIRTELTTLFGIDPDLSRSGSDYAARVVRYATQLAPDDRAARIEKACVLTGGRSVPDWAAPMSWGEARALVKAGHELGSGTMTHAILTQLGEHALEEELADSRELIAERTGVVVRTLAYPRGASDGRIADRARAAGYETALSEDLGQNARGVDRFHLARRDIASSLTTPKSSPAATELWLSSLSRLASSGDRR